jgi:quercetin 2,3-dioxygenase
MAWGRCCARGHAPLYLDLHLPAGSRFEQALPDGHNAFVYVYRGDVTVAGQRCRRSAWPCWPTTRAEWRGRLRPTSDAKALLIAGRPLNEPIAQYGPFVMNTKEEIYQALADFRDGRLGEEAQA